MKDIGGESEPLSFRSSSERPSSPVRSESAVLRASAGASSDRGAVAVFCDNPFTFFAEFV